VPKRKPPLTSPATKASGGKNGTVRDALPAEPGASAGRRFLPRGKLSRLTWKPQQKSGAEAPQYSIKNK